MIRDEVHDPPILLNSSDRVGLEGMHHIGEGDAIPDEENR